MALDDTPSILDKVQEALEADGIVTPQNSAEENPFKQGAEDQEAQHKARSEIMAGAGESYGEGSVATPHSQASKEKKEKEKAKRRTADAMMQAAADFNAQMEDFNNGLLDNLLILFNGDTSKIKDMSAEEYMAYAKEYDPKAWNALIASKRAADPNASEYDIAKEGLASFQAELDRHEANVKNNYAQSYSMTSAAGTSSFQKAEVSDFINPSSEAAQLVMQGITEESLNGFIKKLDAQVVANAESYKDYIDFTERLQSEIDDLESSPWRNDPDMQAEIATMRDRIEQLDSTFERTAEMNSFLIELKIFTEENKKALLSAENHEEMIVLAFESEDFKQAYNDLMSSIPPEERKEQALAMGEKMGLTAEAAERLYERQLEIEQENALFSSMENAFNTAYNSAYEWGMSWFSQPTEDTASESEQIIAQQQEQIDALIEQKSQFMDKINAMDNPGGLMNYYFSKAEELDAKIVEMQTQLDDYKTAIAELEAAEQNLADLDKQLEQTEAIISDLSAGGMSTAPHLANNERTLAEQFANPDLIGTSGNMSTRNDTVNMSRVDPKTLKIRHAEFQANILETEQADAAAAVASAAALKEQLETQIQGGDAEASDPALTPDAMQLALDNNIEKINGLFSGGATMSEEDFVAWAKENGIEIPSGQETRFTDMVITKLADNGVSRINPIAPRIDTPDAPNSTLSASRAGPPSNPGLFNAAAAPAQSTPEPEVAHDFTPKQDPTITMGANA